MKTLIEIYNEHGIWEAKNFPDSTADDNILGIIEEIGELAHAILKQKQGIRVNEDHTAKIKDAVADVMIFLFGYIRKKKLKINALIRESDQLIEENESSNLMHHLGSLSIKAGFLARYSDKVQYLNSDVFEIIASLYLISDHFSFDFLENLNQVWEEVKQRDWSKNKETGTI